MNKLISMSLSRLLLAFATLMLIMAAPTIYAADIRVEDHCSLYDAINSANNDRAEGRCDAGQGDDTIILTRDMTDVGRLPNITSNIYLEGNHHDISYESGDLAFRVEDAKLVLARLNIEYITERDRSPIYVYNGELTVLDTSVENCVGSIYLYRSQATARDDSDICGLSSSHWFSGPNSNGVVVPTPSALSTCGSLSGKTVTATYGLGSGVECQQMDAGGINNQAILDAGAIDAVDVWGYVDQGVDICFGQLGSIIFLDAATSPRTVAPVESYRSGDTSCARLTRPGTVVLTAGEAPSEVRPTVTTTTTTATTATTVTTATTTTTAVSTTPTIALPQAGPVPDGCPIITTGNLKLRAEPSLDGEILGYVVRGSSFDVIARTSHWFQVNYQGVTGWIGKLYVAPAGDCA